MQNYEYKHKILGYKDNAKVIELDDKLISIGSYLEDIFSNDISLNCNLEYDGNLKKDAKKFFKNNLIKVHNVLIERKEATNKVIEDFNNKEISTYNEMLRRINGASKLSSPFNIPITFKDEEDYMFGTLYWRLYSLDNEEFLKKINPIFKKIELSSYKTKLSYLSYIHELTHSQVDSVKDSIENYYYGEVASIFFERIAALQYDNELLNVCTFERYQSLYGSLCSLVEIKDVEDNLVSSTYIISTLIAEKLFDIYLMSDSKTKKIIMNKMQMLMDGKTTLENILKDMDITLDNSKDINILKKHL